MSIALQTAFRNADWQTDSLKIKAPSGWRKAYPFRLAHIVLDGREVWGWHYGRTMKVGYGTRLQARIGATARIRTLLGVQVAMAHGRGADMLRGMGGMHADRGMVIWTVPEHWDSKHLCKYSAKHAAT